MCSKRELKSKVIDRFRAQLSDSESVVLVNYKGITVKDMEEIRNSGRKLNVQVLVVKNSLAKIAVTGTQFEELKPFFKDSVLTVYSSDPINTCKIVKQKTADIDNIKIVAGSLGNSLLNKEDVLNIANISSKDELKANLLATMQAPASKLLRLLKEPAVNFVNLLRAYSKVNEN